MESIALIGRERPVDPGRFGPEDQWVLSGEKDAATSCGPKEDFVPQDDEEPEGE
jgi:hypothetical protein